MPDTAKVYKCLATHQEVRWVGDRECWYCGQPGRRTLYPWTANGSLFDRADA